jgi:hypothetical protein
VVEAESIVLIGLFGAKDNECDGATVIESATIRSSSAGVAIRGERIGAKGRVLIVVVADRSC